MSFSLIRLVVATFLLSIIGCSVADNNKTVNNPAVAGAVASVDLSSAPPLANAGGDQTVSRGGVVTLDSRRSFHPAGRTFTLVWSQTAGKTIVTLANPGAQPGLTNFQAPEIDDVLTFKLVATDDTGLSTTDQAVIHVVPSAELSPTPTINTEGDEVVSPSATFVLLAEVTFGVLDGPITWTQVAGPATVPLAQAQVNSYSATAPKSGVLIVAATGSEAGLRSAPDYSVIAVSTTGAATTGPTGAVAQASPAFTSAASLPVMTVAPAATVSLADDSETEDSFWQQVFGLPVPDLAQSADGLSFSFTAPATVGSLGFALTNPALAAGLRAAPIIQEVNVVDPALVGVSVQVGSDQFAHLGDVIVLAGSASLVPPATSAGLIYRWTSASSGAPPINGQASGPVDDLSDPNEEATVTVVSSGAFAYALNLTDVNAPFGMTPSATLTVTTLPASQNLPPVIVLNKQKLTNGSYQLTAAVNDPENDPTSGYSWSLATATDGILTTPNQLTTNLQLVAAETVITFAACDSLAACNQATIAVP